MSNATDLLLIKHNLRALRERYNEEMAAIESVVDRMLDAGAPTDSPNTPASRDSRRRFYRQHGIGKTPHKRAAITGGA